MQCEDRNGTIFSNGGACKHRASQGKRGAGTGAAGANGHRGNGSSLHAGWARHTGDGGGSCGVLRVLRAGRVAGEPIRSSAGLTAARGESGA